MEKFDELEPSSELTPRSYQVQLEEIAYKKNTLIHLPTGSGKTFIAIQLIKRFRHTFDKPWGEGGKRCFFLVNTVPLVNQQKKVIKNLCPVKDVGGYSGEDNVDYWDKRKWDMELVKYEVIVMTCQILNDMLTHNYIRIEDISLLIFDECHHAVDDHPMRLIMKHFECCPTSKHPRVLGLSATLLNCNVKYSNVEEVLRELEQTFQATIATVNELGEVLTYSTNPKEIILNYTPSVITEAAQEAILILTELQDLVMRVKLPAVTKSLEVKLKPGQQDITSDPQQIVKGVKKMIMSMIKLISELGVYGGSITILAYIILLERLKRRAFTKEEETLYAFTITHCLEARLILLDSMQNEEGYDRIIKHSSQKVLRLLDVLKEYNPNTMNKPGVLLKVNIEKKPLSAIIFTQERFTSKILYNILKEVRKENPVEFGFLKHDFIVGFNVNPFNNTREQHYTKKLSTQALLKFKNRDLNCMISTSVIEEGVDIPQCLLVLRYDPPKEYRSYIQSKGRARNKHASYVLLVNINELDKFQKKYTEFQRIEKYIHQLLVGKTDERDAPTEEDIQKGLYEDDEIEPYYTQHGARLSATSAISLLNRYCSILPHDLFTTISPMWIRERGPYDKNMIMIIMPVACPIKEPIKSDYYADLKTAKRSAALKACIQLHKIGELDPVTLLPRIYAKVDFDLRDVRACFPNWPWNQPEEDENMPKAGTKKRVRKHMKLYPKLLDGPKKWNSVNTFYLHIIKLEAKFEEPKDSRERSLYNFLKSDQGYGLLSLNPLPIICDFPSFLKVGEVKTSLEVNYAVIQLNAQLFNLVKEFHFFLFDQVLEIAKKFLVFDGRFNNLYVVPINGDNDYDIDWDVMQTYKEIPPTTAPTIAERKSLIVTREEYKNAVVTPYYRANILPDRYIVSDVLEYMTPLSKFDSEAYATYEDYYSSQYNLQIEGDKHQPLLEVCNITTRMNCLMPRAATLNTLTDKQKRLIAEAQGEYKKKGFPEIFVPEFCIKMDFPGILWFKATMLPSIIHRVTMLLTADELRVQIAQYINKTGRFHLEKGERWLPVISDKMKAREALLMQIEEPRKVKSIDRMNNPGGESYRPLNIISMRESVYQLQKKKISKEYPWAEDKEPIDIERNLSEVTLMDIECYDAFVTTPIMSLDTTGVVLSPPRQPSLSAAILPPPLKYQDKIAMLSKKPTPRGPELRDILSAITTINSHDTFDLERAETLGDSFLKYAASLYLFHKFPEMNEGQLTNIKGRLIGNRNLFYAGERVQLGGRMKVEQFSPCSDFIVPGFFAPQEIADFIEAHNIRPTFFGIQFTLEEALSGRLSPMSQEMLRQQMLECLNSTEAVPPGQVLQAMQCYVRAQAVSDKSVADCVEALIGTYLVNEGIPAAVSILEWMKIIPPEDNFIQFIPKKQSTVITQGKATVSEIEHLLNNCRHDIERVLNYKFKDPSLLLEAMSHASYIRNRYTRSYERLEFLGDAILDFLITAHIFENTHDLKPGDLTDLRSALVNNVTFASYVVKLGLHKYMCSQLNPALENAVMNFVEHQVQRDHEVVEDVLYLIDEEDCTIAEYIEVPKVLSDIFESLTGAMYLDSGGNLSAVWSVIYRVMCKEIDAFSMCIPKQPVRVLYENIHACPVFGQPKVTASEIPKVMIPVTFSKEGRQHTIYGVGANKSQAKRAAAKLALKIIAG